MQIQQVQQISEEHCGPAVLQMLLGAVGVETTQEEITIAAGAQHTIREHGTTVVQLAHACNKIAPQLQFWYKYHASLDDIKYLLSQGYVVGVEWQGLFYGTEEEEEDEVDDDTEFGHYSVISHYDAKRDVFVIVDPYQDFANQDRIFSSQTFNKRWWDTNEITDPDTGESEIVEDTHLLFFVTPGNEDFSPHHGFKRYISIDEDE